MIKICKHCGEDFDIMSYAKKQAGGYINECADCVVELGTETAVRYRGVISGDGKMAAISIVRFDSEDDAEAYVKTFNASGAFGGRKTNTCNTINHYHVGANIANSNHKGKK